MKINLNKAVKVFHPNANFLQIYFEAVANAIDAGADRIEIAVKLDAYDKPDSLRIDIVDNGRGFTDSDYGKFSRLLEVDNEDHKGLGRLVFLAYFNRVSVVSHFEGTKERAFTFDSSFEGKPCRSTEVAQQPSGTRLEMRGFNGKVLYRYEYVTTEGIRTALLQEFMPTFFRRQKENQSLTINISLETSAPNHERGFVSGSTTLSTAELPSFSIESFKDETLDLLQEFQVHFNITSDRTNAKSLVTSVCVDGRAIAMDLLPSEAIPGAYQMAFFFTSDYFTGKTNTSRQKLNLDAATERTLKNRLRSEIGRIIAAQVPTVVEQNKRTARELDERYPHLVGLYPKETAGLLVRAASLEEAQKRFFREQSKVLECDQLDDERYEKAIELSARTLMEYVMYRDRIIKKLKATSPEGSEDAIHNIIVPTKRTLPSAGWMDDLFSNNVWLLDDRYMSYSCIVSEQEMTELLGQIDPDAAKDESRPDIGIVFSGDPNASPKVDVVVVELKKSGLKLAKNEEVISQLRQRATKLVPYLPKNIERMWFFGVTQITPEFRLSMRNDGYREFFSHGQSFHKHQDIHINEVDPPIAVDIVIMDYPALIGDAESRNETFMKVLRNRISTFATDKKTSTVSE